jgi:hypothetical protein
MMRNKIYAYFKWYEATNRYPSSTLGFLTDIRRIKLLQVLYLIIRQQCKFSRYIIVRLESNEV